MSDEMLYDDGTAERAEEIAAGWIGRAWFRNTVNEKGNGGELMLRLADSARSHITKEQWQELHRAEIGEKPTREGE